MYPLAGCWPLATLVALLLKYTPSYTPDTPRYTYRYTYMPFMACPDAICHMLSVLICLKMPQNGLICHNCDIIGVHVQCVSRVCPTCILSVSIGVARCIGVYPVCSHGCICGGVNSVAKGHQPFT